MLFIFLSACAGLRTDNEKQPTITAGNKPAINLSAIQTNTWVKIFDGETLKGWVPLEKTKFDMGSKVDVKDGNLLLAEGKPYSALIWGGTFPTVNYEVRLRAKRVAGDDIFCGLLFPVDDSSCSLILGGWQNSVTGLSSVDEMFAVDNNTANYIEFDNNKWYKARLRVTEESIRVWLDGKEIIRQPRKDHRITPYPGLELFEPFGLFTYCTSASVSEIYFKMLE